MKFIVLARFQTTACRAAASQAGSEREAMQQSRRPTGLGDGPSALADCTSTLARPSRAHRHAHTNRLWLLLAKTVKRLWPRLATRRYVHQALQCVSKSVCVSQLMFLNTVCAYDTDLMRAATQTLVKLKSGINKFTWAAQ